MADVRVDVQGITEEAYRKLQNPSFGLFLAHQWKRLINPYTPHRDGNLEQNVTYEPFAITYNAPYSHYQYNGVVYEDPIYHAGGFTNNGGIDWWSRPGIKKQETTRPLNYLTDHNPQATHHWDKAAEQAGQKDKLIADANRFLRR